MKSYLRKVLVTGGAGYIGSHVCIELINNGYFPVVVDNLSNGKLESLARVEKITGVKPDFFQLDINDKAALHQVFSDYAIGCVMHFAGLKAVGESTQIPIKYYRNNVSGTLSLLEVMEEHSVFNFVFSSSATVYGDPVSVPIDESFPLSATNPYGRSKLIVEDILRDMAKAPDNQWNFSILRYFNPAGAHESGLIGEDPKGIPNNLIPYIAQVAVGKREALTVYGNDYATPDGTGVRDYIHVVDLARGHVAALNGLTQQSRGCSTYNLGTGTGYSVLEMLKAFELACGKSIPYVISARRPGDIASCYADVSLAKERLGWAAEYSVERMMADTWRWQSRNPNGFAE
ncbi:MULTISPECIES: UDP-glucose 4-epimerase GalE [unclassified Cellvibrio]|uniref:UDP-glucose 4-epimerase GalE n=1 Tax=unclassified Cellvibrio TaxID=2624793 RepID=UPI00058EF11F|nr:MULTISPECIES: UDP-glucose 4-epimerase GalE [unclassified Cellvibrio]QEY14899.1 UDP-glucose 4-epimerase GalE [Cellvibrio sp. KY-GH-1]UUA73824.1 UDP-glucose 4-epimerase GalE [Cellvibrio sp. QJXJ]